MSGRPEESLRILEFGLRIWSTGASLVNHSREIAFVYRYRLVVGGVMRVDAGLVALSSAAATTLVTSMTTDSWEQVKAALVKLWRLRHPGQAKAVGAELTATRSGVVAARAVGDEQTEADLLAEWRSRLRRLIADDKQLQDELRRFTEEFRDLLSEHRGVSKTVLQAEIHGSGRVYQAGHDQTVISS